MAFLRDVTEKKLAEEAQKQRQAEFQDLWEAATDGRITVNSKGIITLVNSMTEEMFGYSRQELIGQPVEKLLPAHLRKSHERFRKEYQLGPYRRNMGDGLELIGIPKSGEGFPIEISLTPIKMREEQEVLAEIHDISDRKVMEDKLRQSQKLEAVGQLAGGIAHDLNNILTAIIGFAELSKLKAEPDQENFEDLDEVLKAGERA